MDHLRFKYLTAEDANEHIDNEALTWVASFMPQEFKENITLPYISAPDEASPPGYQTKACILRHVGFFASSHIKAAPNSVLTTR